MSVQTLHKPRWRQLTVLVHGVLDVHPALLEAEGDLIEFVKHECARLRWAYRGDRIANAVAAVVFVRRKRTTA